MDNPTRRFPEPDYQPEQGTRRLDETNGGPNRPCLRCGYPMSVGAITAVQTPGKLVAPPNAESELIVSVWLGKNRLGSSMIAQTTADVLVCTRCGYTELAVNPARLR